MNIQDVTPEMILKAYSGKANTCYCGCAGRYFVRKDMAERVFKERGYRFKDDEKDINDKQVTRILNIIKAFAISHPKSFAAENNHHTDRFFLLQLVSGLTQFIFPRKKTEL